MSNWDFSESKICSVEARWDTIQYTYNWLLTKDETAERTVSTYTILFVCLFVYIQYTTKRLNLSGPNSVWDLTWYQGRFNRWLKFPKLASNKIQFSLNFKNPRIFFFNPRTFYKEKMFTIEIGDVREAT